MGINSTTLKLSTMIDDLIGNRAGDTVRVTLSNLGLLLAGGGTLASAERMIAVEGLLADLVLDLGPIHASVAAGLSATIAGQQFRVQSADPDVSYSVYLHAASNTGTLIAAVPAPAVLSTIMADVAAAVTGKAAGVPDIESLAGVPIILDAAEAPVMTAGPQGLDFIPAPGLKARILDALDTPETLLGAVILEDDLLIHAENLALPAGKAGKAFPPTPAAEVAAPEKVDAVSLARQELELILRALEDCLWVQKNAARKLGISPRALNYKITKLGITHPHWRRNATPEPEAE